MIREPDRLLMQLRELHGTIRDAVVRQTERATLEALSAVVADDGDGDTIFAIDRTGEDLMTAFCERVIAPERPLLLIAEGLPDVGLGPGRVVLPTGYAPEHAEIQVLFDPIDGTRELMYQKRSAWILTGVAPNRVPVARLREVELALQTEIPLAKAHLADQLWAMRGAGMRAERYNRLTGERTPIQLRRSAATTIEQGFASFSRFFPGIREVLAQIDEEVMRAALGAPVHGQAQGFEDQ